MKQNIHTVGVFLFLLFLLIDTSAASARKLGPKQGETIIKINNINKSVLQENIDPLNDLMEVEKCENEEECLMRRGLAEAHLDYIYTQNFPHKP